MEKDAETHKQTLDGALGSLMKELGEVLWDLKRTEFSLDDEQSQLTWKWGFSETESPTKG